MPFANAGGVRLHYRIDGDAAAPPLVLSNSLGASLEMWEPQMAELSRTSASCATTRAVTASRK